MLRNLGRGFALALISAWGCNDVHLELAPKPPATAAGTGGDGQAGEAQVGSGGTTAGRGSSGAGLGGFGNSSNAGGADDGPAGSGGCGPTGCGGNPSCNDANNCKPCKDERDCGPGAHCDVQHFRCVECRAYDECPDGTGVACANDCPPDSICDWASNTCRRPCGNLRPEPCEDGQTCNYDRNVCVECNLNRECVEAGRGQVCLKPLNVCVECAVGFDSPSQNCEDPDRPICHASDFSCYPCSEDYECGPKGWQCDGGRCRYPQSPPPQP